MKHQIMMIPPELHKIDRAHEEGVEMYGAVTEAVLTGTIDRDGLLYKGLLAKDKTICVSDTPVELIMRILPYLKAGRVYKKLSVGTIDYEIRAKLILITCPFKLTKEVKEVFDIVEPQPIIKPIHAEVRM